MVRHVVRILGRALLEAKAIDFGPENSKLTDTVKDYIFSIALSKNKGNSQEMKTAITSIVPHAFGEHENCGIWCRYDEDPSSYKHKNLPGGKDLRGDGLKSFLTETPEQYARDDTVKKLVNLGSTQRNESLNNVVGSKNLNPIQTGGGGGTLCPSPLQGFSLLCQNRLW